MTIGLRRVAAVLVAAAFAGGTILLPQAASAAIYQCGIYGSRWTGWTTADHSGPQPSSGIEGSSSYIYTNYQSNLCSTDDDPDYNFSLSYNMVYDASRDNYAQAGTFWGYGLPCVYSFVEQTQSNHQPFRELIACTNDGERHAYRNLMTGQYNVTSSVDGINYMISSYNPFALWDSPFDIQFMGETKYLQSDVPGIESSKEQFTAMGVQRYDDDALVTTCGNAILAPFAGTPGRYATDSVSCKHVRTWTQENV